MSQYSKIKLNQSRGRLIIRNLSNTADENHLKKYMLPYGDIKEVIILKKENGRRKGVAFVEFSSMDEALKAIKGCNLKNFMGRHLAVDVAVPKKHYVKAQANCSVSGKIKQEPEDNPIDKIKIEVDSDNDVKSENESDEDGYVSDDESSIAGDDKTNISVDDKNNRDLHELNNDEGDNDEGDNDDGDNDDGDNDDDDNDDDDDDEDTKPPQKKRFKKDEDSEKRKPSKPSVDIVEGKTLFIRNLFYDTDEDSIESVLSQYGKIIYVLVCKDRELGRSRGSAFVKCETVKDCEAILAASNNPAQQKSFFIDGRQMVICQAVSRDQASVCKDVNTKAMQKKDKRNMYLVREGVVREGTRPAEGVSKKDLQKRVERELVKRKMLANLNIFVSPLRLCIHNIPLKMNDKELLQIFKTHSPKGAVIKECRIMRNLVDVDDRGVPMSKGYGFVAFTEHEDALNALRTINNNPSIFTNSMRPIVEFSLENKAALMVKEKRMKNSIRKNTNRHNQSQYSKAGTTNHKVTQTPFMGATFDLEKKGAKAFMTHVGPKNRRKGSGRKNKKTGSQNENLDKKPAKVTRNKLNHQAKKAKSKMRRPKQKTKTKPKKTKKIRQ